MQRFALALFAAFIGFALPVYDAEAKRLGGGKSFGMQRDSATQRQATPPQRQDNTTAQNAPTQGAAAQGAAQAGKRNWLGPVAGIAAGLGLVALASHFGLGEEFANILLIALLAMGAFLLFRWFTRKPAQAPAMQYAGATAGGGVTPFPGNSASTAPAAGAAFETGAAATQAADLPPGFDAVAFAREAKLNFLRLQAAYDAGNLDDIRAFTAPEVFAEIQLQLAERGAASQRTEVTQIDAYVVECAEEDSQLRVSVRFTGEIREDGEVSNLDEIWHLTKPAQGGQGWVVAGIQQLQ